MADVKAVRGPQEEHFVNGEGDRWFERNRAALLDADHQSRDWPLRIIAEARLKPARVLEIGCSNGWRLDAIRAEHESTCVGVEPSEQAISEGRSAYPEIDLREGTCSAIPIAPDEKFDLVVVNYVFHWVSRQLLGESIAQVDRVVADGGFLLVGDFLPDAPTMNPYHHLPDAEVFTFKLDYSSIFTSMATYSMLIRHTYDHDGEDGDPSAPSQSRGAVSLLRKSLSDYYSRG